MGARTQYFLLKLIAFRVITVLNWMTLNNTFDIKMTFSHRTDLWYGLLALKPMGKVAFHRVLVVTGAVIWHSLFRVAAISDFAQTSHQRASSVCDGFSKTLCPYLTPCQITKTSHQVHDDPEFFLSCFYFKSFLFYFFSFCFTPSLPWHLYRGQTAQASISDCYD